MRERKCGVTKRLNVGANPDIHQPTLTRTDRIEPSGYITAQFELGVAMRIKSAPTPAESNGVNGEIADH
jgi:hypothetical protein